MTVCRQCKQDSLRWVSSDNDTYYLVEGNKRHVCPPVTTVAGLTPGPEGRPIHNKAANMAADDVMASRPLSADFAQYAQAAVMDAMAQVSESFHRAMDTATQDHYADVRDYFVVAKEEYVNRIETIYEEMREEFRLLMPQQHELVIRTPDLTTVVSGRPHYQLQRLVDWLNLREHVMAVGPAGSGKTTAAAQAADVLGLPHYILPCGMATNDWSLLGFINPQGSYIPGHMRQPFEHGGVFVLDEIDNTNPSVLTTINGALSGDSYQFPDALVKRHSDFVTVGCANTYGTGPDRLYVGRNQLDAATLDRFKKIAWGIDEEAEFDWAGRDQTPWVRYVQRVRACASELSMRVVVSPRASIGGAKGLRNGLSWADVAEDCLFNGMSSDDSTRILEIVSAI